MRPHLEAGQETEQHNDGQSCHKSGKPPTAHGIVNLIPSHGQTSKARGILAAREPEQSTEARKERAG
jgi:hypothetical protein